MELLLAGGRQSREAGALDRDHRPLYDRAILARFDTETLELTPWLSYVEPGAIEGLGHRFGAPSVSGDQAILCTEREVLRVGPTGSITSRWSDPNMNDLHYACEHDGVTYAVSSGTGAILSLREGRSESIAIDPPDRPPHRDLRGERLRSDSHPNYLWWWNGAPHATLGRTGAVRALPDGPSRALSEVVLHDGVVTRDGVWLTRVDGKLILLDPTAGEILRTVTLSPKDGGEEPLGWCRGLLVDGEVAWVGFTRIRATALRRSLAWARGRLRGKPVATRRPTRLCAFALSTGRCLLEIPLAPVEIDVLMGISPAGRPGSLHPPA